MTFIADHDWLDQFSSIQSVLEAVEPRGGSLEVTAGTNGWGDYLVEVIWQAPTDIPNPTLVVQFEGETALAGLQRFAEDLDAISDDQGGIDDFIEDAIAREFDRQASRFAPRAAKTVEVSL